MTSDRTPPNLFTLVLLTGLSMLTLNMFLPSLPAMAVDFNVAEGVMALAVSGVMLVQAVLQIVMGPLSDRMGRRPVILFAMTVYVGASVGCVWAEDATVFLFFRFAQGIVVTGMIVSYAAIRDQFPPSVAAGKMGTISAAMAMAPMLGPMLGGFLDTALGWRVVFMVYTAFGLIALILVYVDFGETRPAGPVRLRLSNYSALLGSLSFVSFALCSAFGVGTFFIFLAGAPFVAGQSYGLSPALIGIGLGSITGGYMTGAAITSRLSPRQGIARMLVAGRIIPVLGLSVAVAVFLLGYSHPILLFGFTLFVGLGNGLTLPNSNAGALSVRPDLAGTAAGLNGATGVLIGAVLTSVTVPIVSVENAPLALLTLMLASMTLSFLCGLVAIRATRGN